MSDNYKIGNVFAIGMLDKEIRGLSEEVKELEDIMVGARNVANKIAEEYNKKKAHLAILEAKKREILGSTESYSSGLVDNLFNGTISDFVETRDDFKAIPENSKNKFARLNRQRLEIKINSLKKKSGMLSKFQRRMVSSKLKRQLRTEKRKAKNAILDQNIAFYDHKYKELMDMYEGKMEQARIDGNKLVSYAYYVPAMFKAIEGLSLIGYTNLLKHKNNLVEGAIQLPKNVVNAIKNRMSKKKGHTR